MRSHPKPRYVIAAAAALFAVLGAGRASAADTAKQPSFKEDVLPIFEQHCTKCHAPDQIGYQAIGLDLSTYRGVMAGSRHGPAVIPHQPQIGSMMKVLDWKKDYYVHMPAMGHQLPQQDLEVIRAWIADGAKDN